ncbi:MAG: hypothetical protein L0Z48_09135, partial [candidate division Zixibacteria bacterium]|nr:hypothetical protein [candidate division Zixibacteria bacterium]
MTEKLSEAADLFLNVPVFRLKKAEGRFQFRDMGFGKRKNDLFFGPDMFADPAGKDGECPAQLSDISPPRELSFVLQMDQGMAEFLGFFRKAPVKQTD